MSLTFCQYLACRVDQKTCVKCVVAAGLELAVVPMLLKGDELCTDMALLEAKVKDLGSSQIVAVLSTTSCFAPRAADDLIAIAKLCYREDIGHVINNAYGVQVESGTLLDARCSSKPKRRPQHQYGWHHNHLLVFFGHRLPLSGLLQKGF